MSQEIYKLTVAGQVKWRGCNTNSGLISLDDKSIEPLVSTLDEVVDRLMRSEHLPASDEREQERVRLIQEFGDRESYLNGHFVLSLDDFFHAVDRITQPDVATQIELTSDEVKFLVSVVETIKQELSGDMNWRNSFSVRQDQEFCDEIFVKLFPKFDLERGVEGHPALLPMEVDPLNRGLSYFDLLAYSRGLADYSGS